MSWVHYSPRAFTRPCCIYIGCTMPLPTSVSYTTWN